MGRLASIKTGFSTFNFVAVSSQRASRSTNAAARGAGRASGSTRSMWCGRFIAPGSGRTWRTGFGRDEGWAKPKEARARPMRPGNPPVGRELLGATRIGPGVVSADGTMGTGTLDGLPALSARYGPSDRQRRAAPRVMVRLWPCPSRFHARTSHRAATCGN